MRNLLPAREKSLLRRSVPNLAQMRPKTEGKKLMMKNLRRAEEEGFEPPSELPH